MLTSQLAERETLNGPSLEKAFEGYSATLRSSTRSRAKSFRSQNFNSGHLTCSTTCVATSRDLILRCWELGAISRMPDLP